MLSTAFELPVAGDSVVVVPEIGAPEFVDPVFDVTAESDVICESDIEFLAEESGAVDGTGLEKVSVNDGS